MTARTTYLTRTRIRSYFFFLLYLFVCVHVYKPWLGSSSDYACGRRSNRPGVFHSNYSAPSNYQIASADVVSVWDRRFFRSSFFAAVSPLWTIQPDKLCSKIEPIHQVIIGSTVCTMLRADIFHIHIYYVYFLFGSQIFAVKNKK